MPLNLRAQSKVRSFNVGVSYRMGDQSGKMLDARNVNTIQNRLDTRFGSSRYNSTQLSGRIRSLSYFEKSNGSKYIIALVGTSLYAVAESGAHTEIAVQMPEGGKHRGITVNDRHIIAVHGDSGYGLYSFDGDAATFSVLGQAAPIITPTGVAGGGESLTAADYRVAVTFYASSIGFESNYTESASITVGANGKITVSDIQPVATNNFVNKVRIYLKNVTANGAYLYVTELDLGTTSYVITANPASSQTPPTKNAPPQSGGAKYLAQFGSKTVYAGRGAYLNEVYFSEDDLPDAYDNTGSQLVLVIPKDGGITGLATGLYSDSHLSPYLVIFKRKSTHIYSDLAGDGGSLVCINDRIGCVSHDSIILRNGALYFLSEEGWRAISNGRFIVDGRGEPITLGNGDIDDIFKSPGFVYEVNRQQYDNTFSVYYPALDQYMTWVAEGANNAFTKTYAYEFDLAGFKPWEFPVAATCACVAKDYLGRDMVVMGSENGFIIKHSIYESKNDVDNDDNPVPIAAHAILPYLPSDPDFDATYNFRELIVHSILAGEVTVKTFLNYTAANVQDGLLEFTAEEEGFILDESLLDEGLFGDERGLKPARIDINRVGHSIAFGFYQNETDGNLGLVSLQLDLSKNGNRNVASEEVGDDVFGSEEESLYPENTPTALRDELEAAKARITALELEEDVSVLQFSNDSSFPAEGAERTLYIDQSTNTTWRWDTATELYVQVGGGGSVSTEVSKVSLANNSINPIGDIGEYLSSAKSIMIEYYIYRRTDLGSRRVSGRIRMNGVPDAVLNADKWEYYEEARSEVGSSGVSFSIDDTDTEKSVLVVTLDNMAGAGHQAVMHYKVTKLLEIGYQKSIANNATTQIPEIELDLAISRAKLVNYYLYRRTDATNKRMSGSIMIEGLPDDTDCELVELERSEIAAASGVTFSINAQGGGVFNLVATADNMAGAGHDCKFYYVVTDLPV